ncbi:MAG: carboxypeptidase-like regulatory domain-containing protein, partial [Pirellulales bacterium]
RLHDGKPARGAGACLCPEKPGKFINMALFVKNGRFPYRDSSRPFMKVGADGQLRIEPQGNEFLLIVLHDQGYAQVTSKELMANPQITLQAWARLEGVVRHGTKPVPGTKVDVYPTEPFNPRWSFLNFQEQTKADAEGKFIFAKLKPGKWRVRELPVNQRGVVGPRLHEKAVELAAGQTLSITLGGVGRPVVGQIQWPGGKPPEGDLSRIGAEVRPKMPEFPSPPKATQDQGPDAVRAWMKQWRESEEGKAWQRKVQQLSGCPRRKVSVNRDGALRVEDVVPGRYELGVYVRVTDETLPWEQPQLLHYTYDFSVPEIPGGVSDEPLNLGNVLLVNRFPRKPSTVPVKPPAAQAPGEKSAGGLSDHLELLRYVVVTYKENKAKIRTWQGKATVESRSVYATGDTGDDYSATVQFVFDRTRRSVRWNNTLEKWTKITQGQEDPQPVPQIVNGMMTPAALYRLGRHGSPGNPAKRPLMLTIYSSNDSDSFGRMQPQLYDFNPLYYLDTPRGDVARDLSGYLAMADHPGINRIKVIRAGDEVTIDMSMDNVTQRYTVSLSRSCNPIRFETVEPTSTWENHWTYELREGIWLPKTWTQTIHQKDRRDEQRKVTFVESLVNQKVEPAAFSISHLGLQRGDKVDDRRTGQKYQYKGDQAP